MANIDLDDISVGDLVKSLSNLCKFFWVIILCISGFCLGNGLEAGTSFVLCHVQTLVCRRCVLIKKHFEDPKKVLQSEATSVPNCTKSSNKKDIYH